MFLFANAYFDVAGETISQVWAKSCILFDWCIFRVLSVCAPPIYSKERKTSETKILFGTFFFPGDFQKELS